jgi:hypothetical protein
MTEQIRLQRCIDLIAVGERVDERGARRGLVEAHQEPSVTACFTFRDDCPGEWRHGGAARAEAIAGHRLADPEGIDHRCPRALDWPRVADPSRHRRASLAGEVGQVETQVGQIGLPAVAHALELIVPALVATKAARDHTDDAGAAGARLDQPLAGKGRRRLAFGDRVLLLVGEAARRIPGRYNAGRVHVVAHVGAGFDVERDCSALAPDHRSRKQPRCDPRASGDRLPDLLRGTGHFDLELDRPVVTGFVVRSHRASFDSEDLGTGCAARSNRWRRPPGTDSSW